MNTQTIGILVVSASIVSIATFFPHSDSNSGDYQNSSINNCTKIEEEFSMYAISHRESEFPRSLRIKREACFAQTKADKAARAKRPPPTREEIRNSYTAMFPN